MSDPTVPSSPQISSPQPLSVQSQSPQASSEPPSSDQASPVQASRTEEFSTPSQPAPDPSLQTLLIQQLLEPSCYPHPVNTPIQLIQTHISLVFLTGEIVYKVKKSVNFGFLDFSTLEQRHQFCQEEVRLNQRGAPALYIGVVPITMQGQEISVGGSGTPIDYAVKMWQFPQDQLFSALFERDRLTPSDLIKLGQIVAAFHQRTQTSPEIRHFGRVTQIKAAFDENYQQTEPFIGGPQTEQQFQETKAFSDRFFADHASWFEQRQAQDKIRECHGDLHLRNICYWQGDIQLFDCIEFNQAFRFVDVMYDVAFTVMDLDARDRADLATVFLNTYLEQTGDWEGCRVLPLYRSRQAYVRAKVQSFISVDEQVAPADRHVAAQTAARYYHLAWQYTQPKQGRLWLMSGLSGSGKSTIARQLAPQVGALHLRSDAVRKHLAGIPLHDRGGKELYTAEMTEKTYQHLIDLGLMLARQGYAVILDAKFDRQRWRRDAIAQATACNIPLTILHCTAPLEVLRDRLNQRQGDIADATADLLAYQSAIAEPFTPDESVYVKTLDTMQPINFSSLS